MYKVFIVFANGHNAEIGAYQYEINACDVAKYHAEWCGNSDVGFEVWRDGGKMVVCHHGIAR